ncbi:hypothetical protein RCH20_001217 [Psychrobacter sp. PL15]|uniref:hypothetical protein n=1 Tax=unclassified Psychrobacter TaxID=196806 RepID=UPI001AE789FA|nr:hypothetical protein [Psychrobacter sp. PL15]MEC5210150.1 hypothetical protein [Psychrobacter sp. PL15]
MLVKNAHRLRSQVASLSCQASVLDDSDRRLQSSYQSIDNIINTNTTHNYINGKQQGASTLVLALFVVAVLVTAIVGLMFGHKLGYQRGYYSMQTETKQAFINSEQATKELTELRLSDKILTNQAATAKQELTISLSNLDDLRQAQQALEIENKQMAQLNELYANVIGEKGGMPLQVLGAKIAPLPENAFEYGFDIGMLGSDGQAKNLQITLTLLNDNSLVEVPLEPARYNIQGIERVRGRFVMPSGFKPLQIKLSLKSGAQEVEQLYDWKLGAMVDNMPLSLLDLPEADKNPIDPE